MEEGCIFPLLDRNAVGEAGTGGLATSCLSFLLAHGKTPEEQGGRKTPAEESHSWSEGAQHICVSTGRRKGDGTSWTLISCVDTV